MSDRSLIQKIDGDEYDKGNTLMAAVYVVLILDHRSRCTAVRSRGLWSHSRFRVSTRNTVRPITRLQRVGRRSKRDIQILCDMWGGWYREVDNYTGDMSAIAGR
jgi:hypothetical protein